MSNNDQETNGSVEAGSFWTLKSERRRPKREFPSATKPAAPRAKRTSHADNAPIIESKSVEMPSVALGYEEEEPKREEVTSKEVEKSSELLEPVLHDPEAIELSDSPLMLIDESQKSSEGDLVPIESSGEPETTEQKSEKGSRPLTRQMARQSGAEVWPWMSGYPATTGSSDEDEFVTDEVEIAAEGPAGALDGLLPPRSMNYLEPAREQAKLARKSDLELLKQSRLNRQQRHTETPDLNSTEASNLKLPIFAQQDHSDTVTSLYSRSHTSDTSQRPRQTQPSHPQEALEARKKRRREFDAKPDDYLPSFGPDFIVDDGSGYSIDPRYRKPQDPRLAANQTPAKKNSKSDLPASYFTTTPRTPVMHSTSSAERFGHESSTHRNEAQDAQIENTSYLPSTTRSAPSAHLSSSAMLVSSDLETSSRASDPWAVPMTENSNAASVATSATLTSAMGSASNTTHAMAVDSVVVPKLRLTMRVKDESFFISCPPDSTFAWLQQEASNKYKQVTRLEVAFDHLETVYGSRLMPTDLIREYMNDLESVVGIIKESKPLSLVTLYKSDCQALSLPENEEIVSRLSRLESQVPDETLCTSYGTSTIHLAHSGVHRSLPMQGLSLTQHSLSTLFGLLNLHSFACIDFSSNALSSFAFCDVITELCKSKELENLQILSFRDNLLGLALDIDPIRPLFSKLAGLTTLDLSENSLNDRAVGTLVPIVLLNIPSLTSLDLSSNFFGLPAIQAIAKANANLSKLKTLCLARNPLNQEAFSILLGAFPEMSAIEHLDFSYTDIFSLNGSELMLATNSLLIPPLEDTIEQIGSKFTKIRFLGLRGCRIDSHTMPMLLPMLFITLKRCSTIDLADCNLNAHDTKILRSVLQSPHLTSINLSFNNLRSVPTARKAVFNLIQSIQGRQVPLEIKLQNCRLEEAEVHDIQQFMANGYLTNTVIHLTAP